MNQKTLDPRDSAILTYSLLCGAAIVCMFWALLKLGVGYWGLFPVIVGLASVLVRWRLGSVMLLVIVAVLLMSKQIYFHGIETVAPTRLPDLVLCGSVMAYVAGHYRLLGCIGPLFPPLPRMIEPEIGMQRSESGSRKQGPEIEAQKSKSKTQNLEPTARPCEAELAALLLMVPVCAGWAALLGGWLWQQRPELGLPLGLWQLILLIWLLGLGFFVMFTVSRQWQNLRMTEEEAGLVLQDVFWQETRAEQRRINYWLAWARARARKRKDMP